MKSDTSPARHTLASRAFFILAVLGGLFLAGVSHAANVTATFNSAADIPVTANGYTATGNTLDVTLNFAPTPGTNLTVVRNTALTFINGTFDNVANGATLNLTYNGTTYPFVAWYYGGAGRDLVLLWPYTGLAAWGSNAYGQLGNTAPVDLAPSSVDQTGVLSGKTIVQVSCGTGHTLALTSEGKVFAWGYNGYGQLGDNTTTGRSAPVAVNTTSGSSALFGKKVVAIAAGGYFSLALCSDGTVTAWGLNNSNQLGVVNDSSFPISAPVAVNTTSGTSALFGKTVTAISAGDRHGLALCSDGTLVAWGDNSFGQIGDNGWFGIVETRSAPVLVNRDIGTSALYNKTVTAISAGGLHNLALCSDGTVVAWGYDAYGQLGDNSNPGVYPTVKAAPVIVNQDNGISVLNGKTVTAISAGNIHSLALCSDGTVAAWGDNQYGQLGDNTTTRRYAPVTVNAVSGTSALFGKNITSIIAENSFCGALASDGTVLTWGNNDQGLLGSNANYTPNIRTVPVAVDNLSASSALIGRASNFL